MDLMKVLEKTISSQQSELKAAQSFLEQAAQANLPELLKSLSEILKHAGNSPVARMQAGLQLKNALYSKDPSLNAQYQQWWLHFSEDVRNVIKQNVMSTLGTETIRPSSAAQCAAYIARIELQQGICSTVIAQLTQNVTNPASTEMMKESSLEAIRYICEDIDTETLQTQSNEILVAILHGMKEDEPSTHVRLEATNALLNSLEFTKANFDKENERHFIMQVVCNATQSVDTRVRVAALQCLVKMMSFYYQYMEHYMGSALFAITTEAMKSDIEEISLQGIEFWSTVCDEECAIAIELSETSIARRPPKRTSRFYAKGASQYLVPILFVILTRQCYIRCFWYMSFMSNSDHRIKLKDESDDDDEWNSNKAAGVCLMALATCCGDNIVIPVLSLVQDHIQNQDWKYRDAAVMAFGSIVDGPDPVKLKPIAEQTMPMLIELLNDPSLIVRNTAAWTVGRMCNILPDAVINEQYLNPLLLALLEGLNSEPRVPNNVFGAFSSLAEAAYENAGARDDSEPETYCLSSCFETVVEKLIQTADRFDGNQHNLRNAAYEALMEMIKNSAKDCYPVVRMTAQVILEKLDRVLQMENMIQTSQDRSLYIDLQFLLCATLQGTLRKMTPEDASKISDQVISVLLRMFQTFEAKGGVQEDALLVVSTLAEVQGENFLKYMDAFKPYLSLGLKNYAEYQVCIAAIGLVGDLCRGLGQKMLPFCDEIMMILLENLANVDVNISVKPHIFSLFGDLALAIGLYFKNYLEVVLTTLKQASQAQVDKTNCDMIDYLNELREGCLEAYTGIVLGMKGENSPDNADLALLQPHVGHMISFIECIALDEDHSESNIAACCGLIGDLCTAFGASILPFVDKEPISSLLTKGRRSKFYKSKTLATWATKEVRKLTNASSW